MISYIARKLDSIFFFFRAMRDGATSSAGFAFEAREAHDYRHLGGLREDISFAISQSRGNSNISNGQKLQRMQWWKDGRALLLQQ